MSNLTQKAKTELQNLLETKLENYPFLDQQTFVFSGKTCKFNVECTFRRFAGQEFINYHKAEINAAVHNLFSKNSMLATKLAEFGFELTKQPDTSKLKSNLDYSEYEQFIFIGTVVFTRK